MSVATGRPEATDLPQVTLSSLEHYAYCPRQAGLILLEDGYADDTHTVRGTLLHQRVHDPGQESRPGVRTLRALPVWHDALGLAGVCDVVEIGSDSTVLPVEHKSGPYTPGGPADVQVAGQAMCLEERFDVRIDVGVVYSSADRRRHRVAIDEALRARVIELARAVRLIQADTCLPDAPADKRCRGCSMNTICMPRVLGRKSRYDRVARELFVVSDDTGPDWCWDD